ncbi:MAG TPA: flavin reductase family protein [Chitinophagaceae bacterium]|nr:flavin reductase family protein [Chitinophagaceae bacterium]MCC6634083.1 flavin reductase family protein [Chitinophagaceae bacterium]HMZ46427.1 flavin reductase family protein [Chitinophagaceae bacterium]HNE94123.1 flavin reductase family protein [Chitinophagaceae bacterium]HNF30610.1 flavin reductase family protein [Chitinophagaceae bacterium]
MFINLSEINLIERQAWLQHAIAPRPICFVSTTDKEGNINLSPFSFFNLFSSNPPIVIFSPARSGRTGLLKDTFLNVQEVPEIVINICDFDMVQQVSLSSCEYPKQVDEFIKAGFTKVQSTMVKPPMVKESKINLECKVIETKSLGEGGGAGQLVFAEVLCMHINESILNEDKSMIDHQKMHHIARLGGDYYASITPENLFTVPKPIRELGIGVDALPEGIRNSTILTGNNLGMLANVQSLPQVDATFTDETLKNIVQYFSASPNEMEKELHNYAKELLDNKKVKEAWQVLLTLENN